MSKTFKRFTTNKIIIATISSLGFLLWCGLLMGIRVDHFYMLGISLLLYFSFPLSRKLFWFFLPFLIYLLVYDSLRIFPNYDFNDVHISQVYELEKKLFGIFSGSEILTPNQYLAQHTTLLWDVLSGLFYLSWIPIPIAFGLFLFFSKRRKAGLEFWVAFFIINILAFIIYYSYPAAPPWYVEKFGFELIENTRGSAAGLQRFDDYFNITIFHEIYSRNASVFAAIPSLHAAYPLILVYFGWKNKMKILTFFFVIQTLGVWYSAVYSMHHYIVDVIAGILCTIVGIILFEWLNKNITFEKIMANYLNKIKV